VDAFLFLAHQLVLWLTDRGFRHDATDVYIDQDDALRMVWNSEGRNIEIVFPFLSEQPPYLYYSDPDRFDVISDAPPLQILAYLEWVYGGIHPSAIQ